MGMDKATEIGTKVGQEFLPHYNDLTTSDLQGCIEAAVRKEGLTGNEAREAEEVALQYIYERQR